MDRSAYGEPSVQRRKFNKKHGKICFHKKKKLNWQGYGTARGLTLLPLKSRPFQTHKKDRRWPESPWGKKIQGSLLGTSNLNNRISSSFGCLNWEILKGLMADKIINTMRICTVVEAWGKRHTHSCWWVAEVSPIYTVKYLRPGARYWLSRNILDKIKTKIHKIMY